MPKWIRKPALDPLAVSMSGVKLGDRLLVIGCGDPALIARLASKAGLTGRACAVDENEERATEAGRVSEREGVLIEAAHAPGWRFPYDNDSFDVAILRELESVLPPPALSEARRVLRAGGRAVAIVGGKRRGLAGLLAKPVVPDAHSVTSMLSAAGFLAVRTLAEREGMLFVEGVRKNA